jgi:hypothetical protein
VFVVTGRRRKRILLPNLRLLSRAWVGFARVMDKGLFGPINTNTYYAWLHLVAVAVVVVAVVVCNCMLSNYNMYNNNYM